jgi:hypothetical protein
MSRWPLALLVLAASSNAWALKPQKHRDLAEASCKRAGLNRTFCERMGKAAYETDAHEWDDLSAHAQTPHGGDRCSAAQASADRLDTLGRQLVAEAHAGDLENAAVDLGRAIHTLQDECAHHGMTNEQHSYFSLEQTCGDQDVSPDIQPDAIACAAARTDAVFAAVAPALAGTDWYTASSLCEPQFESDHNNTEDACLQAVLPTPWEACDFLALHDQWDGIDSTWNSSVVGPALIAAFFNGLHDQPYTHAVCASSHAIDPIAPAAPVTQAIESCTLTDIGCFGKVDGAVDPNVDPYGDPVETPAGGGCDGGGGGAGWLAALLALYLTYFTLRSK